MGEVPPETPGCPSDDAVDASQVVRGTSGVAAQRVCVRPHHARRSRRQRAPCVVTRTAPVVLREMIDARGLFGRSGRPRRTHPSLARDLGPRSDRTRTQPRGLSRAPDQSRAGRTLDHAGRGFRQDSRHSRVRTHGPGANRVRRDARAAHVPAIRWSGQPISPVDSRTGHAWALCTDEALLAKQGAGGYAASLSRNLYQPEAGADAVPFPVEMARTDPAAMGCPRVRRTRAAG